MHRGLGVVMHPDVEVAAPSIIFHGVTFGNRWTVPDGVPSIRPFVFVGAGATLLGDIVIGSCSIVASGAVVTRTVPPLSMARGNPATFSAADRPSIRRWFGLTDEEIDVIVASDRERA